ncbi:OmpA family protein [Olivibacter sp. XZL3]|uniref:OmpA family protein n=1 Tax=Olivibacter sp. XZL3 TaxID=1735116 RepID=UPI0010651612|nr:OmpA family protein [Olivibacter sp. XZL3]
MNIQKTYPCVVLLAALMSMQACKSKKMAVQPSAVVETEKKEEPVRETKPEPAPVEKKEEEPVVEKPNYNFKNILFEFDSGVLKTESYSVLDQIVREMKKDPAAKFTINGHASLEGSAEHNMALSVDRANAVKLYLVNAGINPASLTAEGFGATKPVASNDTEEGKSLNRRVEIKLSK